ncbi:MAG: 3-phosphoshikimate 1-carboxyvinyltransferase [Lachnospiraceae bacterium]|nr:3-phosphoshikimate 1-carboxyvinyltransferase [Lachnospiraceae bacterium]
MEQKAIDKLHHLPNTTVSVPGSKSVTNRALLLAALADGKSILRGVQFSDDSRHFLASLAELGFQIEIEEALQRVTIWGEGGKIPKKRATIDVGSAGTAARFLTAMLAFSDGTYEITCSAQMEKRPMEDLFVALKCAGAKFIPEDATHLPVRVQGCSKPCHDLQMDIHRSTQFLSALLLTSPMLQDGLSVRITSEKKTGSYIAITREMLKDWGVMTTFDGDCYQVPKGSVLRAGAYDIEPDVSGACYFYALAAITGGKICVRGVKEGLMQGDMKFLEVLSQMGAAVRTAGEGIEVEGPSGGLHGISVQMNDFSDQALTLAAIAPFADAPVTISGIGHIRGQECDRLHAMEVNLASCGIRTSVTEDCITIYPGTPHGAIIQTFEDHRVAMAFSVMGCVVDGIVIENPMCCQKTFENFYEVLANI